MSVVEVALKRPYTVVASLILIGLMGLGAALRMPIDIFPEIDIPVVAVVWTYNGMSASSLRWSTTSRASRPSATRASVSRKSI